MSVVTSFAVLNHKVLLAFVDSLDYSLAPSPLIISLESPIGKFCIAIYLFTIIVTAIDATEVFQAD